VQSTAAPEHEALAYDPQTAGGFLVTLPADKAAVLEATFADRGVDLFRIGGVEAGSGVVIA
jgi:selenophosphate synthase